MQISVVIPAYGRPERLERAVRSVLRQEMDPSQFEVIVVDSSPTDENAKLIESMQGEARCRLRCFTKQPEGPGPSRNLGAREAEADLLAFLDSDCWADPDWLASVVAAFDDDVGLVQGRVVPDPEGPQGIFTRTTQVEDEYFIYVATNITYRREAFEGAGGFQADALPKSFDPIGGEDVELAWSVKSAGWRSRFAREAVVTHEVLRITPGRWLVDRRIFVCPRFVRRFPETRRFLYARFFFDRVQALLCLGYLGIALALLSPIALVLVLPYVFARAGEQTRALRGPLRVVRALVYLPRDSITLGLLVAGSIRYGALVL